MPVRAVFLDVGETLVDAGRSPICRRWGSRAGEI
jgi:hypothetical protein